ncbi:hypothetical protein [Pararhizobium arenae]|uniref:hypothetical protein n=1 Tax=Pararhizobium arenae TaxID=1856850 RepID=UPI00094B2761|nr:hypothetical protein [Pararhizobium arenae]
MHTFTVTTSQDIQADSAEEAALLMYQALLKGPPPLRYAVTDESGKTETLTLDLEKAADFAAIDHTADPGNW